MCDACTHVRTLHSNLEDKDCSQENEMVGMHHTMSEQCSNGGPFPVTSLGLHPGHKSICRRHDAV